MTNEEAEQTALMKTFAVASWDLRAKGNCERTYQHRRATRTGKQVHSKQQTGQMMKTFAQSAVWLPFHDD